MQTLVSVRDLRVEARTDAGRRIEIIRGVGFDVAEGEVVALIGESGSGKTTIAHALLGHSRTGCRIVGGSVVLAGEDMTRLSRRQLAERRGALVSYVPQSAAAAFNPAHTVLDQVTEVATIHGLKSEAEARAAAIELFRALALPDPETIGERYPHQLSGGQLQRLAAAMALIGNPALVVFDEPTTALDVTTQIEVLRAFKAVIKSRRIAAVYVSHDLAVVAQMADRIVVLKGGEIQEQGRTADLLADARHPYTRELLAAFAPSRGAPPTGGAGSAALLDIRDVVAGYGTLRADGRLSVAAVDAVSLSLAKGANLGIIGESGSGKSTLARVIAGIHPAAAGSMTFEGRPLAPSIRQRSREQMRDIQIVFQHADTALNPARSVEDILGRPLYFYHGLRGAERQRRIDRLLDMVRLPGALRHRRPGELSGGQKQRVNLARALAAEPKLVLCDEVTSALDTVVAAAIIDLLKELQRELGLSYLFISHDLSTVRAICDEVVVMYRGRKVEQLAAADMESSPRHPYSRQLFSSVPRLDPTWLDGLPVRPGEAAALAPA